MTGTALPSTPIMIDQGKDALTVWLFPSGNH